MGAKVTFPAMRSVEIVEEDEAVLEAAQVRVRTIYSGISAGTELTAYRGTSPHVTRHWDADSRLFTDGATHPSFPVTVLGYEEIGEVVEISSDAQVTGFPPLVLGDRVWGTWGHRTTAVIDGAVAASRRLPAHADPRLGIFSHIGAVALNAVIDADIHVGETVVVFGLGVPGQIVAQLARLNGARVIGVDAIESRRDLAEHLGTSTVLDSTEPVAELVREMTGSRGADVAIEISGNARALHEAVRTVAYNSRVVAAGFQQGDGLGLRLGEEFHHNRIQLVSSQISGSGLTVSHRWDRLRLNRTVLDLAVDGTLDLLPLITHTVALHEVADAYRMLDERAHEALQVVIDMTESAR